MDRIHSLKLPYPRRLLNLESAIGMQTSTLQRMSGECFIVRRPEHERLIASEFDKRQRFTHCAWPYYSNQRTVPTRGRILNNIGKQKLVLITQDNWQRRANGGLRHVLNLNNSVSFINWIHSLTIEAIQRCA